MEQLSQILKNVHKGWATSILGVLIIIACIVCVFLPATSWEWDKAIIGIGVGVAFLGSPDPKNKSGVLSILFMLTIICISISCQKYPTKSTTSTDSSWVNYKKDSLLVKGQSVKAVINYDSIKMVLSHISKDIDNPKIFYNSADGKQRLEFSLDKKGNLIADCSTSDKLVEYLSKEVNRLQTTRDVSVVHEPPTWLKYLLFASIAVNVVLLLILIFKR